MEGLRCSHHFCRFALCSTVFTILLFKPTPHRPPLPSLTAVRRLVPSSAVNEHCLELQRQTQTQREREKERERKRGQGWERGEGEGFSGGEEDEAAVTATAGVNGSRRRGRKSILEGSREGQGGGRASARGRGKAGARGGAAGKAGGCGCPFFGRAERQQQLLRELFAAPPADIEDGDTNDG